MRLKRTLQASPFDSFAGHGIGRESEAISAWPDDDRELLGLIMGDLRWSPTISPSSPASSRAGATDRQHEAHRPALSRKHLFARPACHSGR
jgi:hypothetical protein